MSPLALSNDITSCRPSWFRARVMAYRHGLNMRWAPNRTSRPETRIGTPKCRSTPLRVMMPTAIRTDRVTPAATNISNTTRARCEDVPAICARVRAMLLTALGLLLAMLRMALAMVSITSVSSDATATLAPSAATSMLRPDRRSYTWSHSAGRHENRCVTTHWFLHCSANISRDSGPARDKRYVRPDASAPRSGLHVAFAVTPGNMCCSRSVHAHSKRPSGTPSAASTMLRAAAGASPNTSCSDAP